MPWRCCPRKKLVLGKSSCCQGRKAVTVWMLKRTESPSLSTLLCTVNVQSYRWILDSLHCCLRTIDLSCSSPVVVISLLMESRIFRWPLGWISTVAMLPAPKGQVVASVVSLPLRHFHMASLGHFWSVRWIPYLQIYNWDGIFPTGCKHCSLCVGVFHLHHKTHGNSWAPFKPGNRAGRWWWNRTQGCLQVTANFWDWKKRMIVMYVPC